MMLRQVGQVSVSPYFCPSRVRKQCSFEFTQLTPSDRLWFEVCPGSGLPAARPHDLHLYELPRLEPEPVRRLRKPSAVCSFLGTLLYLLSLGSILCSISPACHSLRLDHSADDQQNSLKFSAAAGPLESIHRKQQAHAAYSISPNYREQSRSRHRSLRKNGGQLFGRFNRSYPQSSSSSSAGYLSASDGWKQLQLYNCFVGAVPEDLLSAEDVTRREGLINLRSVSKRRLRRMQQNGFLSRKTLSKRNRRLYPMPNNFERSSQALRKSRHRRSPRSTDVNTTAATTVATVTPSGMASATTTETSSARDEVRTALPKATATVHRLAIRSNTIVVEDGLVRARLRYLIQLHQAIQGVHKLVFEIRINPDFRPVYVGTVEDVCSHWTADAPGSRCSQRKKRFYQNDQICVCNMPPGLYHQRLKINLAGILDGMDVPRFMIDFLFNDQRLNLYVTARLQAQGNKTVACMQTKLPVHFKST